MGQYYGRVYIGWIGVAVSLLAVFLFYQTSTFMYMNPTIPWLEKIKFENSLRYDVFYKKQNEYRTLNVASSSPIHHSVHDTIHLYERLIENYSPTNSELIQITKKCEHKSEFELINDVECKAWWYAVLAKEEIVDIGISLGFLRSEHKLGAVQVLFANGMKGWFKPCGLHSEYPENEIIAGVIDFLMGFNRAPASVMRNITVDYLVDVVRKKSSFFPLDQKYYILDQIFATCSDNGMLCGAMTGWWHGIQDGISLPKTQNYMQQLLPGSSIQEERRKLSSFENAEQIHSHILVYLLNILRVPGKNEFISYHKDRKYFLGIDLDRTNLVSEIKEIPTFCEGCLIGNQTLYNLENIYYSYEKFSVELLAAWKIFGGFVLQKDALEGLYTRLQYTIQCFDNCLLNEDKTGIKVVIPDYIWNVQNTF